MNLRTITVNIDKLIQDPANARSHSKRNIQQIAESLAEFGQRKPIVVTSGNLVLAGNGTHLAAKLLGWEDLVAVVVPDEWTELEQRAFAIADNRTAELARWDGTLLAAQLERLGAEGFTPTSLGFELPGVPPVSQNPTSEVNIDELDFDHQCPDCGFEFDVR